MLEKKMGDQKELSLVPKRRSISSGVLSRVMTPDERNSPTVPFSKSSTLTIRE